MTHEYFGQNQSQPEQDWEAMLAAEGMPNDLPQNGIPSGDALDIKDPGEARHRTEEAAREEQSDAVFDSPDTSN
jgi:hypothetical protein